MDGQALPGSQIYVEGETEAEIPEFESNVIDNAPTLNGDVEEVIDSIETPTPDDVSSKRTRFSVPSMTAKRYLENRFKRN